MYLCFIPPGLVITLLLKNYWKPPKTGLSQGVFNSWACSHAVLCCPILDSLKNIPFRIAQNVNIYISSPIMLYIEHVFHLSTAEAFIIFLQILSRDSVTVAVDAVVYYKVFNPIVAIANVENFRWERQAEGDEGRREPLDRSCNLMMNLMIHKQSRT